jgi:hypothetical protein
MAHGTDFQVMFNFLTGDGSEQLELSYDGFGSMSGTVGIDNLRYDYTLLLGNENGGFILNTGLGITAKKFRFRNPIQPFELMDPATGRESVIFAPDPNALSGVTPFHDYDQGFFGYGKSKFVATYVRVPLSIGYVVTDMSRDEDMDRFRIEVGGYLGYALGAKFKRKFEVDGDQEREVNRGVNDLQIQPFVVGAFGRVEFLKAFGVYAGYQFTPLFRTDRALVADGPNAPVSLNNLRTFEVGITFNPFALVNDND